MNRWVFFLLACCLLALANAARGDPYAAPEAGGPLHLEVTGVTSGLNLRESPSTRGAVVATLKGGAILANMGCTASDGRDWCYVQPFGGGAVGYVAADYLRPAISPNGAVVYGPDDSALRAGQGDFDASGFVKCAQSPGQEIKDCKFGVARHGGGYATVVVERPDGRERAIFFQMGVPIGADTSEADGYHDFSARRTDRGYVVEVGPERYDIFDAVVLGG